LLTARSNGTQIIAPTFPTVACRAHNGRAVGTSQKRQGRNGRHCCAHHRHVIQPTRSFRQPFPSAQFCARSGRPERQAGVDPAHQKRAVEQPRSQPERVEVRTINAQIGVQPATINVPLDVQIGSQKEGLEGGWQDKRIVSAVSVFAADSGTCSADMGGEGHTNIGWQDKRNPLAVFAICCPEWTWRNL